MSRDARDTIAISDRGGVRGQFAHLLPAWIMATDEPRHGVIQLPKAQALEFSHIQVNPNRTVRAMLFDHDDENAGLAWDDANLCVPNWVAIKPENGHAHLGYILKTPVGLFDASRRKPVEYMAAIERGYIRRLGADPAYRGNLTKNPMHKRWHTIWVARHPYALDDLASCLDFKDMQPWPRREPGSGVFGRNVETFDRVREIAYARVLQFKRDGADLSNFRAFLEKYAYQIALQFIDPLPANEARSIAKSVGKWTWQRFTLERFSEIQSERGKRGNAKRWANHTAESATKPWIEQGISRRTYYRRKAHDAR